MMTGCGPDGGDFPRRLAQRFASARRSQRLSHPCRHRHPLRFRDAPELTKLVLLEEHLKSLSHLMMINDS